MKNPNVNYVSKFKLYPAFGEALEKNQKINIRKDLPKCVQRFVLEHEKYHLKDWRNLVKKSKKYNWIFGEIKANIYAAIKHPLGFFICTLMSLSPYRIKFYIERIFTGK